MNKGRRSASEDGLGVRLAVWKLGHDDGLGSNIDLRSGLQPNWCPNHDSGSLFEYSSSRLSSSYTAPLFEL